MGRSAAATSARCAILERIDNCSSPSGAATTVVYAIAPPSCSARMAACCRSAVCPTDAYTHRTPQPACSHVIKHELATWHGYDALRCGLAKSVGPVTSRSWRPVHDCVMSESKGMLQRPLTWPRMASTAARVLPLPWGPVSSCAWPRPSGVRMSIACDQAGKLSERRWQPLICSSKSARLAPAYQAQVECPTTADPLTQQSHDPHMCAWFGDDDPEHGSHETSCAAPEHIMQMHAQCSLKIMSLQGQHASCASQQSQRSPLTVVSALAICALECYSDANVPCLAGVPHPHTSGQRLGNLFPRVHVQLLRQQRRPGVGANLLLLPWPSAQPVDHLRRARRPSWQHLRSERQQVGGHLFVHMRALSY